MREVGKFDLRSGIIYLSNQATIQMAFRETNKYWVRKGPRFNGERKKFLYEQNQFSGEGLLPNCHVSFSNNIFSAHGTNKPENMELVMYDDKALVEISQCASMREFNGIQFGNWETEGFKISEMNSNFLMHKNFGCKEGSETLEGDFSRIYERLSLYEDPAPVPVPFCLHYRMDDEAQKMTCNNQHFTTHCSKKLKDKKVETEVKKCIPVCRKEKIGSSGICNVIHDTLPLHSPGFHSHRECEFRKKANFVTKAKKWVPVQVVKTVGSTGVCKICNDTISSYFSYGEMNYGNSKGNVTEPNKAPEFRNDSAIAEVHASDSTNVSIIHSEEPKGKPPYDTIGLKLRAEALTAAYRLQLESERAQLEMGQPLAEFERFIQSACPVISFSHRCLKCKVCLVSHVSSSFICKHQMPSVSLASVWDWYHKPGSYGLEITAVDYSNQMGRPTKLVPFQAHFVPFLSAVQLFRYARPEKQQVNSLDDSELIFEFFESELPHMRKPLHVKIAELAINGASNQVFGDPSKLESLNLHDLHPASWYSVAWYPIYRIPEGNFQASFLTYHSFGHLVQTSTAIIAPVLGLESYNTRDECWFDLRIPVRSSSKEFSQDKMFEMLVRRLRTLQENAFLFSRGCVCKNNVEVFHHHPDYEFFFSRKHLDWFFL